MKDGFYLSTYLCIDELSNIMNISRRDNQNIALWHKCGEVVKLIHYWEFERVTGLKMHSKSFYSIQQGKEVINTLLKEYDLTLSDMVEIWGTPQLDTNDTYHSDNDFKDVHYHSICHLFSAIMMDTDVFKKENIIGLAVDGGPDFVKIVQKKKYSYVGCFSNKGEIEAFDAYSPGLLWIIARNVFKMREGSLMALATACESELYGFEKEPPLINNTDELGKAYEYIKELVDLVNKCEEDNKGDLFSGFDHNFSIEDNKISMAMKIIQKASIKIMENNIERIIDKYDINPEDTYLALAGGFILNCPTNSHLMKKYKFKGFMAPPCVSDTGMALGTGLYAFYKKINGFDFKLRHAFYGDKDNRLDTIIESKKYDLFFENVSEFDVKQVVKDIQDGPIVWFNGAAEVGPRALGNRSIIADPTRVESKDKLNVIKKRQWWRPVAPIVLLEDMEDWFEDCYESPFMLHTFKIKSDKVESVPAIAHIDNSSRAQTIKEEDNEILYKVIKAFKKETGVPIVCNTSLNDKGEPIINTIDEAVNFCLRKNIDILYVNGNRIKIHNHDKYTVKECLERNINVSLDEQELKDLMEKANPHKVSQDVLEFYFLNPKLVDKYDIKEKSDVRELELLFKCLSQKNPETKYLNS